MKYARRGYSEAPGRRPAVPNTSGPGGIGRGARAATFGGFQRAEQGARGGCFPGTGAEQSQWR